MQRSIGPYIEPLKREDCPELEPTWKALEDLMGFVPNAELAMARTPRSLKVLVEAVSIFYATATLPKELLSLVGLVSSTTAGCEYCVSQNVAKAKHDGASMEKMAAAWDFEKSELFSEAERSALSFTLKATQNPNTVQKCDVDRMLEHYNEVEVTEITSMIGLFGIFNRFNNAIATAIEPTPLKLANAHLPADKWQPGVHGA